MVSIHSAATHPSSPEWSLARTATLVQFEPIAASTLSLTSPSTGAVQRGCCFSKLLSPVSLIQTPSAQGCSRKALATILSTFHGVRSKTQLPCVFQIHHITCAPTSIVLDSSAPFSNSLNPNVWIKSFAPAKLESSSLDNPSAANGQWRRSWEQIVHALLMPGICRALR